MRQVVKSLLLTVVGMVVARAVAMLVSRRFDEGSEVSDEFRRVVVMTGLEFRSRAGGLRRAQVSVLFGGAKVDLRDAVVDPAGARIRVENTLGGLKLVVRRDWAVTVEETLIGGGEIRVDVADPDDLPENAPRVAIDLMTRLGSTVVSTR